jgi:SAM-dependent methyltransferase
MSSLTTLARVAERQRAIYPACEIPEGVSGRWRVERYAVATWEADAWNLRVALNPQRAQRPIAAGTYTRLVNDDVGIYMTDTPAEIDDLHGFVQAAHGDVLVTGLGLGLIVVALLEYAGGTVRRVDVVEVEPDVIALVAPYLTQRFDSRIRIVEADALTYSPFEAFGARERGAYDCVWHDIWPRMSLDNLIELKRLKQTHLRYLRPHGFQMAWCESEHRREARRVGFRVP